MSDAPISIQYDCTRAERMQAGKLLAGQPVRKIGPLHRFDTWLGCALFIGLVILLVELTGGFEAWLPARMTVSIKIGMGIFALGLITFLIGFARVRKLASPDEKKWRGQVRVLFDHEGLTYQRPGRADLLRWSHFRSFDEGPDVFALRFAAQKAMTIPKRLFADDTEIETIRTRLGLMIQKPAIPISLGFPVVQE